MKTLHRTLGFVLVLFALTALTAACGDDKKSSTPTTGNTQPTVAAPGTTVASGGGTTAPANVVANVTDGAVCNPLNARGTTSAGRAMVCTTIAGGNETRWRPA